MASPPKKYGHPEMYPGQSRRGRITKARRDPRKRIYRAPVAVIEDDPEVQFISFRKAPVEVIEISDDEVGRAPVTKIIKKEPASVSYRRRRRVRDNVTEVKVANMQKNITRIKNEVPTPGWKKLPDTVLFKNVRGGGGSSKSINKDEYDYMRNRRFVSVNEPACDIERRGEPKYMSPKKYRSIAYPSPMVALAAVKKASKRCKLNAPDPKDTAVTLGSFLSDELKQVGYQQAGDALKLKPGYKLDGKPDST